MPAVLMRDRGKNTLDDFKSPLRKEIKSLREYYDEVDAFELEEESPQRIVCRSENEGQILTEILREKDFYNAMNSKCSSESRGTSEIGLVSKLANDLSLIGLKEDVDDPQSSDNKDRISYEEQGESFLRQEPESSDSEGAVINSQNIQEASHDRHCRNSISVEVNTPKSVREVELDPRDHEHCASKFKVSPETGRINYSEGTCKSRSDEKSLNSGEIKQAIGSLPLQDVTVNKIMREFGQSSLLTLADCISQFCDIEQVSKLGEGTYAEAFQCDSLCFKVVPMGGDIKVNGELQKTSAEMFSEALLMKTLESMRIESRENFCYTFIHTVGVKVCRGSYPAALNKAWEAWDKANQSENDHPSIFSSAQLYCVFILENGGTDLEKFEVESFSEARCIVQQVVVALAVAEQSCEFEHRDLHWGNILVKRSTGSSHGGKHTKFRFRGRDVELEASGLHVSIIDFTLSRLQASSGEVLFYDLSEDPEIFNGPVGHCQFDTYRRMEKLVKGNWQESHLKTNCLWVHYLADTLLSSKSQSFNKLEKAALKQFRRRALACSSASELVQDEFIAPLSIP